MPIEVSHNPHDDSIPHKTYHKGITYKELHGHSEGEGLTCGVIAIKGNPNIAVDNPHGIVGVVTEGVLVLTASDAPNDHHKLEVGHTFHIKKGSTYKWGAGSDGKAFCAMPKPFDEEVPQSLKKPVF